MNDILALRRLADRAMGVSPNKWEANTQLWAWFRSNPIAVIECLQAAQGVCLYPGGLSHTRLHEAVANLPTLKPEEVEA